MKEILEQLASQVGVRLTALVMDDGVPVHTCRGSAAGEVCVRVAALPLREAEQVDGCRTRHYSPAGSQAKFSFCLRSERERE